MPNDNRPAGARHPGRHRSESIDGFNRNQVADIIRNARPTSSESAIDKGSLYRILRNRVYIGHAVHKGIA